MGLDFIRDGFLRAGLVRKVLFLATGGLSGFVFKEAPKSPPAARAAPARSSRARRATAARARPVKATAAKRSRATRARPVKTTRPRATKATGAKPAKATRARPVKATRAQPAKTTSAGATRAKPQKTTRPPAMKRMQKATRTNAAKSKSTRRRGVKTPAREPTGVHAQAPAQAHPPELVKPPERVQPPERVRPPEQVRSPQRAQPPEAQTPIHVERVPTERSSFGPIAGEAASANAAPPASSQPIVRPQPGIADAADRHYRPPDAADANDPVQVAPQDAPRLDEAAGDDDSSPALTANSEGDPFPEDAVDQPVVK